MTYPLFASATLIKKIDVAFDTTTVHRTFAKDADYMAAVAELIRPSGPL
jgi:hypothetical protein